MWRMCLWVLGVGSVSVVMEGERIYEVRVEEGDSSFYLMIVIGWEICVGFRDFGLIGVWGWFTFERIGGG
jgi:hypothetical protein